MAAAGTLAAGAVADDHRPWWPERDDDSLAEAFDEFDRFMRRLEELVDQVPRYAMPEMTEDGDIIIRRLPPRRDGDDPPADAGDSLDL